MRCGAVRVWRAMAWPIGRLWRVCVVGAALYIGVVWCVCRRWRTVCRRVWVRCTVLWRWVYVWLALGMCRVVYVCMVYALGVRVYVDTLTW